MQSSSQAAEFSAGALLIFGALVTQDDPAFLWIQENWIRLALVGIGACAVQAVVIICNGAPSVRVGFGRMLAAFIGGSSLTAVSGALHASGNGVVATALCVILGGVGFWMLIYSLDAGLNKYRESGKLQEAIMAGITGGLARFFAPRPDQSVAATTTPVGGSIPKNPPSGSSVQPPPVLAPATVTLPPTVTVVPIPQPPQISVVVVEQNHAPAIEIAEPNHATNEEAKNGSDTSRYGGG